MDVFQWDHDRENRAQRAYDPESGGWFVMVRDGNGSFTATWKPDATIWANAIGQATVAARRAADGQRSRS
jgi:hypothetical protein